MLIQKDITTVEKGVIMHQVNCQNVMGAGVAKAIYLKHPLVKQAFHDLAKKEPYNTPNKRFGIHQKCTLIKFTLKNLNNHSLN